MNRMMHAPTTQVLGLIGSAAVMFAGAILAAVETIAPPWDAIGTLGVAGVLAWYLYYTTTRSFPAMQKRYDESRDKDRDRWEAMLHEERKHRETESEKDRDHRDKTTERLTEALDKLAQAQGTLPCSVPDKIVRLRRPGESGIGIGE